MTTHDTLTDAGARLLRAAGYETDRLADGGEPAVVATPGPDAHSPFDDRGTPRPVAVEPADAADDPATLAYRLAAATAAGRDCLFVVPPGEADHDAVAAAVADLFAPPALVRSEAPDGCREFHLEEDRVRVGDRGLALVSAHDPTFAWREEPAPGPDDEGRAGTDARRLVLTVDGEVTATLSGVDALACPAAEEFPFAYRRDPEDKRFHVTDRDGRPVGSYPSIAAMRRDGFAPVPSPLVPEHRFDVGSLRGRWAVAVVADGEATLHAP